MQRLSAIVVATVVVVLVTEANAAKDQVSAGVEGGIALPDFRAGPSTTFTLASYQVGALVEYSVTHRLALGARFYFNQFSGIGSGFSTMVGERMLEGQGAFDGTFYEPQVHARFELYSGYEVAPHLELAAGYQWAQYRNVDLLDERDRTIAQDIGDFGRGAFTAEAGLFVDFRLFDLADVGVGVRYKNVFDDLFRAQITVPLRLLYYWY